MIMRDGRILPSSRKWEDVWEDNFAVFCGFAPCLGGWEANVDLPVTHMCARICGCAREDGPPICLPSSHLGFRALFLLHSILPLILPFLGVCLKSSRERKDRL